MTGLLRVPRTRGALSGFLLVLLGAWGALIPFIGPYFHYAYSPAGAWTYTSGRFWLEVLPGAAAVLGGLILLVSALRPMAIMGAGLAVAGGAWFVVGTVLHPLWPTKSWLTPGAPLGSTPLLRMAEQIGFFTGLGVAIVLVAATALGRMSIIATRDARLLEAAAADTVVSEPRTGTWRRPRLARRTDRVPRSAREDEGTTRTGGHRILAGLSHRRSSSDY